MRLGADGETLLKLEIEQQLVSVEAFAEIPEWRPLDASFGRLAPVAFEMQSTFPGRNVQFVFVGVEQLDAVLRPFRKRHAMPDLLARSILARIAASRPTGYLQLRPSRRQPGFVQAEFDLFQCAPLRIWTDGTTIHATGSISGKTGNRLSISFRQGAVESARSADEALLRPRRPGEAFISALILASRNRCCRIDIFIQR
jgi:hypothetical protein